MPICLLSSRPLLSSACHPARDVHRVAKALPHGCSPKRTRRTATTAAALAPKREPESVASPSTHSRVLTTLHKTKSLLPRVLPSSSANAPTRISLELWEELLARAYDELCPSPEAKAKDSIRIVVYGCDDLSGARELVSALLEDPFASESQKELLHSRWRRPKDQKDAIVMQSTPSTQDDLKVLQVQSTWLQQFGLPVQLLELASPLTELSSRAEQSGVKDLILADIPVIVCNPASTPLPSLLSRTELPLDHPNAVLVLTTTTPSAELAARLRVSGRDLRILFVDPLRALSALRVLSSAPSSTRAIQQYQDDFGGSNVSSVTKAVAASVHAGVHGIPPTSVIDALHTQTVQAVVRDALAACGSVIKDAQGEVDSVRNEVSWRRGRMEETKAILGRQVFGGNGDGDEVVHALQQSQKDIQSVMDSLTWWKLPWRVDDVQEVLLTAVDRSWCTDLEYKLVFQAGRLASLQQSFTNSSNKLLDSFPSYSVFRSSLLRNNISQIASLPSFPLDAPAFLQPLHVRRQQLRFPTARLQTTAQHALLGIGGSVFSGMGIAWAGWAGQLGIFDMAMQLETAIGAGMLAAVAGVRWAVGRFERAKKKWWKDYDRIGQGLERDLRTTLDQTLNERVLIIPERTCSGLEDFAVKRKEEIEELKEEVAALERNLDETIPQ
ncbi:uncharacterized protein LAESUDRAFT_721067 [Laetiporus sulphureus 93-53]|uniref:Mmc1 C-terminal domain-containing protein n=1 Tax=Laetiporus sulphureus 93-53 TaxID=1314785 RepID=A0A165GRD4_9APHY|nr:uncharacterized protein LAESUDRAFT_721067 [Laetiporus sulphureus 93-53]KZT10701.1 hypothetical protein LAESUDRAFT_721067 [Laetiporus sulphureus 93-53]